MNKNYFQHDELCQSCDCDRCRKVIQHIMFHQYQKYAAPVLYQVLNKQVPVPVQVPVLS